MDTRISVTREVAMGEIITSNMMKMRMDKVFKKLKKEKSSFDAQVGRGTLLAVEMLAVVGSKCNFQMTGLGPDSCI